MQYLIILILLLFSYNVLPNSISIYMKEGVCTIKGQNSSLQINQDGALKALSFKGNEVLASGFFQINSLDPKTKLKVSSQENQILLSGTVDKKAFKVFLSVEDKIDYLNFRIKKIENLDRGDLRLQISAKNIRKLPIRPGLIHLDYMTYSRVFENFIFACRNSLWEKSLHNPLGSFALYFAENDDHEDNILAKIWTNERLPHPNIGRKWTVEEVDKWLERWITELGLKNKSHILSVDALNKEELGNSIKFAREKGYKFIWQWAGNWRGKYWLTDGWHSTKLNPSLFPNGEKDFINFINELKLNNLGIMWHDLTGLINDDEYQVITSNPEGKVATWGRGKLVKNINMKDKEIGVVFEENFVPPQNGTHQPPLFYPSFIRFNYLRIGKEIVKFSNYVKRDKVYYFQKCNRGHSSTPISNHPEGYNVYGILKSYGQDLMADPNGPLIETLAEKMAKLINKGGIQGINLDGLESHSHMGRWGADKYAALLYSKIKHPTISGSSRGLPAESWLEYRFNKIHKFRPNWGRVRFSPADLSRSCSGLDEINFALSKSVAAGSNKFKFSGHDVKGIKYMDLLKYGMHDQLLELMNKWHVISTSISNEKRAEMSHLLKRKGNNPSSQIYLENKKDSFYEPITIKGETFICEKHILRRPGIDRLWTDNGEVGISSPWQFIRTGEKLSVHNPEEQQNPEFIIKVWPQYDSKSSENIDLISFIHSNHTKTNEQVDTVDTMALLKALKPGEKQELIINNDSLILSCSNKSNSRKIVTKADTRISFKRGLNLSKHRCLGLWINGDASGAILVLTLNYMDYSLKIDFQGPRYIELPSPEISTADGRWGVAYKPKSLSSIRDLKIKFGVLPPKSECKVLISSLKALNEINLPLEEPVIKSQAGTFLISEDIPTGHFIDFRKGRLSEYDEHWNFVRLLKFKNNNFLVPKGNVDLTVSSKSINHLQLRVKVSGEIIKYK